jgi:hypothetical protein
MNILELELSILPLLRRTAKRPYSGVDRQQIARGAEGGNARIEE